MKETDSNIASIAKQAALAAGDILKKEILTPRVVDGEMDHDIKLAMDKQCETAILKIIRSVFPKHSILAEESGAEAATGPYLWVIDPLDGTVNYFYGLPYYCVSIACFEKQAHPAKEGLESLGRPVVGVVYAPPTDELFFAQSGNGAFLNNRPISPTKVSDLNKAMVCMGFGKNEEYGKNMLNASALLAQRVKKIRCLGAAAYDICNVACGRLGAFYEKGLRTWDIAGGGLILKEAGGVMLATEFQPSRWKILSSGPHLYEPLKELLDQVK